MAWTPAEGLRLRLLAGVAAVAVFALAPAAFADTTVTGEDGEFGTGQSGETVSGSDANNSTVTGGNGAGDTSSSVSQTGGNGGVSSRSPSPPVCSSS